LNWYKPFISTNPYNQEVIATYKSRVLINFITTVHPPLVLHDDVLNELTMKKLKERRKIVEEMVRLLRSIERREKRKKKTEPQKVLGS
jgi:hypothetical protein